MAELMDVIKGISQVMAQTYDGARDEKGEPIKAVMAGTVLSLKKKPGDKVKVGDVVLILEAMKMENEISSPSDGVIVDIVVSPGKSINTGDTLFIVG